MQTAKPMVYVVDDDPGVRSSLESLIWSAGCRVASFGSAGDFLAFPRMPAPGCLLLDVMLPDISGLELQNQVARERLDMPIIFMSGYGDVPMTVQAMRAGAVDFFTKPFHGDDILKAIDRAIQRSEAALARDAELTSLHSRYTLLSVRERQVMELVVTGLLNKQVADKLCISEITVKTHRGHAMRKMQANSLADMVKMSARLAEPSARQSWPEPAQPALSAASESHRT